MPWSPTIPGVTALSDHLVVPTATVWRRTFGFAERSSRGGSGPSRLVHHLTLWLARNPGPVSLQLVLQVGGKHRSRAWLGLSAWGFGPRAAAKALAQPAAHLGEALDTWDLFRDVPDSGPRYSSVRLGLRVRWPSLRRDTRHRSAYTPQLTAELGRLHARDACLALVIDIRPGDHPSDLLSTIESTRHRAETMLPSGGLWVFLNPAHADLVDATRRLDAMWEEATAPRIRVHLHGTPPGPLLMGSLEETLSNDLDLPVRFGEGPAEVLPGWRRPTEALLSTLGAGAEKEEEDDDEKPRRYGSPDDDIPF